MGYSLWGRKEWDTAGRQTDRQTHIHTDTLEDQPWLRAGQEWYNHKELNFASNLNEPGSGFLPRDFSEGCSPMHTLILAL